jgi:thiol-disulfide isomerase/thioredoxin
MNYSSFSTLGFQDDNHSLPQRVVNPVAACASNSCASRSGPSIGMRALSEGFTEQFGGTMVQKFTGMTFGTNGTTVITGDDFSIDDLQTKLRSLNKTLVWFYAPWCGHCKSMHKDWMITEEKLRGKYSFIMIDSDKNNTIGRHYGIQGFPTLKYFTKETATSQGEEYNGQRDSNSIINFLKTK